MEFCNFSFDDYRYGGKWIGNCSDPKEFFESIAIKLEDLVTFLGYRYFDGDAEAYIEDNPEVLNNLWTHTDSQAYGRCFSLVPTLDHIKLGIQEISITVLSGVHVFLHTPENFKSSKPNTDRLVKLPVSIGYWYVYEVQHDL